MGPSRPKGTGEEDLLVVSRALAWYNSFFFFLSIVEADTEFAYPLSRRVPIERTACILGENKIRVRVLKFGRRRYLNSTLEYKGKAVA
jgi:hypothetical protein